jgi:hypothetical protein
MFPGIFLQIRFCHQSGPGGNTHKLPASLAPFSFVEQVMSSSTHKPM